MLEPVGGSIHDRWKVWDRFRDGFLEALSHCHGSHNEDDVLVRIATQAYQIWDGGTVATVTNLIEMPRFKAINIFLAAGDLEQLHTLTADGEAWAKQQGISRLICGGRSGWLRAFPGTQSMGLLMYRDL